MQIVIKSVISYSDILDRVRFVCCRVSLLLIKKGKHFKTFQKCVLLLLAQSTLNHIEHAEQNLRIEGNFFCEISSRESKNITFSGCASSMFSLALSHLIKLDIRYALLISDTYIG